MFAHVGEELANALEQRHLDIIGDRGQLVIDIDHAFDAVLFPGAFGQPVDRRFEAEFVQNRRPDLVQQLSGFADGEVDQREDLFSLRIIERLLTGAFQWRQFHPQRTESLNRPVVQLGGNSTPFPLRRLRDRGGQ